MKTLEERIKVLAAYCGECFHNKKRNCIECPINYDLNSMQKNSEVGSSVTPTSLHVTNHPQTTATTEQKM